MIFFVLIDMLGSKQMLRFRLLEGRVKVTRKRCAEGRTRNDRRIFFG